RLMGDLSLHPDAKRGFRASARGQRSVLDQSQRVGDVGPSRRELRAQQTRHFAGEPVIGKKKVVRKAFAPREVQDAYSEGGDFVVEGVLVQGPPGRQIDHRGQRRERFHPGVVRRLLAGEDVGRDAAVAERGADVATVYVQSAVRVLAQ